MKKDTQKNKKIDKEEHKKSDFYKVNVSIFLIFLFFTCIYTMCMNTSYMIKNSHTDYSVPNYLRK